MPELIRRLILATATGAVEELHFPSGNSVSTGGWDGFLNVATGTPLVPSGVSGWEIGTGGSPGKKAEDDYRERTTDPLGLQPSEGTFVFVTPRPWRDRAKWQQSKRAHGTWKDVWALNGDSLEQWLDAAPAVSLWTARQMGKITASDVRDIEAAFTEWSLTTEPATPIELVLAGRTKDAEAIQEWLHATPSMLPVQGDAPDEAIGFLYAATMALPDLERARVLSSCVVVEDVNLFRQLTAAFRDYPLIIVGSGECVDAAGAAVAAGHRVYLAMDSKVVETGRIVQLSRPRRTAVTEALEASGLSNTQADQLARDSGRSLPVLRRQLAVAGAVRTPSWATAEAAQVLLPAVLAGAWNDAEDGDREVIETLTAMTYRAVTQQLARFLSMDDAPVRKVGSVWMMKSPLDAWFILAEYLNNDLLQRFEQCITAVLTQTHPKYDLPADQRWAAAVYEKTCPHSPWVRTGLVESLVLLAVFGNRATQIPLAQGSADHIVKEVCSNAQQWEAWASLSDVTPLLGEAAPEGFVDCLDEVITAAPDLFKALLQDDRAGMFGEAKHAGLLWALEGIAWSSQFVAGAVRVLARLAAIDPGGQYGNRPARSLQGVFRPRWPQTYATPDERLRILNHLIEQHPQLAWECTHSYWHGGSFMESHRFRWRDAGGTRRGLEPESSEDNRRYVDGLRPMLTRIACHHANVIAAAKDFIQLPAEVRNKLIETLKRFARDAFTKDERGALCGAIREALHWINSHDDPERDVYDTSLRALLEKFSPDDPLERVSWLLSDPWPRLPDGGMPRQKANDVQARITEAQTAAARQVLDQVALDRIITFAKSTKYPGLLGYALGRAIRDPAEDARVLDALAQEMTVSWATIPSYARGRVATTSAAWVEAQVERVKATAKKSAELIAQLYLGLPEGASTWAVVSAVGADVEQAYWKYASGHSQTDTKSEAPIAVTKLLDAGRPFVALEIAGGPGVEIASSTLRRLVQALVVSATGGAPMRANTMIGFYLGHVFRQLNERQDLPDNEIALLEWPFATMFDDLEQHMTTSLAIHRWLQRDPAFFVQLITFVSRRDDGAPEPGEEDVDKDQRESRARNAQAVFDSWQLLPGLKPDGSIDQQELTDWIERARALCAATHHVTGGDLRIAFLLARAPADSDGVWPHVAVRNVIELLSNRLIDNHIRIGVLNSRGVVTRAVGEGGQQARNLAARYAAMSDAVKVEWPRTARILRQIARSYEADARHEDVDAELDDLRWG
jgi:hypothetical protein